jgi:acyl carrier protein
LAAIVSTEERRAALEAVIRDNVARVVKLAPERISLDQPLAALGINSVMSLELRSRLERELGLRLSATLIWNYPTIREAAPFLAAKMDLALAGEAGSEPRAALAGAAGSEPRAALAGEAGSEPRTAVAVADRHGRPAPAGDDLAATDPEQLLRRELDELTERLEAI